MKSRNLGVRLRRRIISAALCVMLLGTNAVGALAAEVPVTESVVSAEKTVAPAEASAQQETTLGTETEAEPGSSVVTETEENEAQPSALTGTEETESETEAAYTLHLTHYFRFKLDGKSRSVKASEKVTLTEADFADGVCDLNRFAQSAEQLTVTEANPVSVDDFNENREGGARIVYAVKDGWKIVRREDTAGQGTVLREVFQGALGDYEFVPTDVVRINVQYKYSNTGGLAGVDAASPKTMEATPEKQTDGTYKVTWKLPTVEGFRIVLNPSELNRYVVRPPKGDETSAELEAALERGDFDVDIANHTIYYYQEKPGEDIHPNYQNRYSTAYNGAWNDARTLTAAGYTATAVGDNNNQGANPLVNPELEVTLTEAQLKTALNSETGLDITVYYRRNATWYTVNHWVPKVLSGLTDFTGRESKTENNVEYVRLDQETFQGRVGAMTRATAKIDGVYEELQSVDFSQKLIKNTDTVVDIYYKAAESYRVIFDTDYTYIPRQQVDLGNDVDFSAVTAPKRTGYTFAGWRYLKKGAAPGANGEYADADYENAGTVDSPALTVNNELIGKARLEESGGVLALHLYPKWTPAQTQVRVILWTEDLTGEDDVQAIASGGNTNYYEVKYANYKNAPVTHDPELGASDSHYSNVHSFTVKVNTDSSLVASGSNNALLDSIQTEVESEFKTAMGQASGLDVADFYTQAAFEIVHEEEGETNYDATTASADGKTMIYVYFTRNIYELLFTYYGNATVGGNTSDYCVAINTNGYSYSNGAAVPNGNLNFGYSTSHNGGNGTNYNNGWMRANVSSGSQMPVPQTITIRAKYGADLRDVWPVARSEENVTSLDNSGSRGNNAKMISWGTTDGKYCEGGFFNSGLYNDGEPTIMGTYAAMSAEIVADPARPVRYTTDGSVNSSGLRHNLVAYWFNGNISYYRNNHCFEVPGLDVTGMQRVSIYNNDTTDERNFLYLVPTDNTTIAQYEFNDLMRVSYANGQITYDDPDGTYYAVRLYKGKYYAVARQVDTVSSNTIAKQNPSARLHMTRANTAADHSTQYTDAQGAYDGITCGSQGNPYDLYFYYNRDRYTITYMVPTNQENAAQNEYTLGTVTLPYGALVTREKYGFKLNYRDKNTNSAYGWTPAAEIAVCPDRAENGTAAWTFQGWGLGPAGVNMQWTVDENTQAEAQAGDAFAIESNLRLYAIWDAPTYTVTFHLSGGTVGNSTASIAEEVPANRRYTSTEAVIPRPLRTGYTLEGWYAADGNGNITRPETEFDFDQVIAENKHVAAKWSAVSTETFAYTIYYVTDKPLEADKNKEQVQIDENGKLVQNGGTTYYVLGKVEQRDQMFIANSSLNFPATMQDGYVPRETNKILTMGQPGDTYNVIFCYDPIIPGQHVVNFVEAGTETGANPVLVKTLTVKADQTVVTPQSAAARELVNMGYALVNKDGNQYTTVDDAEKLKWIDKNGNLQSADILAGDAIPDTVTYLVQAIPYTITYENAAGSPNAAADVLKAITAAQGTPVANANGKNPTRYTTKDTFTAKNPGRVYENGKWYEFMYWSPGDTTTVAGAQKTFATLTVDPGTVGNLTFIANWREVTERGNLTVSKTVAGNAGETDKYFHFTVTLSDTNVSGTYGDMTFTDGTASFTLKHKESKTATGLPAGLAYEVTETEAGQDSYATTSTGASGKIKEAGVTAAFTNTRNSMSPDPDTDDTSLTVKKEWVLDNGGRAVDSITVALMQNGKSYDEVTLSAYNGWKHTWTDLDDGYTWSVIETDVPDGFTSEVSRQGNTWTITNDDVPVRPAEPVDPDEPGSKDNSSGKDNSSDAKSDAATDRTPQTGDETNLTLWLILLGISVIGITATLLASKRKAKRKHRKK